MVAHDCQHGGPESGVIEPYRGGSTIQCVLRSLVQGEGKLTVMGVGVDDPVEFGIAFGSFVKVAGPGLRLLVFARGNCDHGTRTHRALVSQIEKVNRSVERGHGDMPCAKIHDSRVTE